MRLTLCEVPTCETRPNHNTGNSVCPTLCNKLGGSLMSPANHAALKMQAVSFEINFLQFTF